MNSNIFPKNLFYDLGVEPPVVTPQDFYPSFMYVLHRVAEQKGVDAMVARYCGGMTYDDIGTLLEVSKQRVCEMIASTLDKLKGKYTDILLHGIEGYMYDAMVNRADSLADAIVLEKLNMIREHEDEVKTEREHDNSPLNSVMISSLRISVRLYNALARNHVRYLGTAVKLGDGIMDFKNFGKACFWELADLLMGYNVDVMNTFPMAVRKYEWRADHE